MFSVNSNGVLTEWSADAEQLTRFTQRDVLGMPLLELITYPFRQQVEEMMSKTRHGVATESLHIPFYGKAGDCVDIELSANKVGSAGGICFACKQKNAHAFFSGLGECLPSQSDSRAEASHSNVQASSMVAILDEEGRVTGWNEEAEDVSLFLRDEVIGVQFQELLTQPFREAACQMIQQASRAERSRPFHMPFYTKAAEKVDVMFNVFVCSGQVVIEMKHLPNEDTSELSLEAPPRKALRRDPDKTLASIWACETSDTLSSLPDLERNSAGVATLPGRQ
eukprot:TRINITY_DN14545_c0_g2_i1.p1 TRINITY_DN14545_c0_g2~~TRINITY_DN14545_c0_g2_i1.p1  ORF type:complete len:280 (-),score=50.68 TRINITY_DN14545_c0_g2_i1:307-1146(-)